MLLFSLWIYHWKSWYLPAFGMDPAAWWSGVQAERGSFLHTLAASASQRGFYYSLAYCLAVTWFGWQRVKRRKTPYVRRQTVTLVCIQWLPLFLLPELLLPWMGRNEWFTTGALQSVADAFFPSTDGLGLEREYWRAYGFILAWPLFVHNWFSSQPLWGWLIVGVLQTFVLIPWMVRRWGKGAYCGWICSCGALAETMGDTHRHKMPHGPRANRWNMVGQVFLAFAALLMLLRIAAWCAVPGAATGFDFLFKGLPVLSYSYFVDLLWAGVIGIAFYFHYSGRVWCRFGCPLAALMHIYARLGKFRIFAEKVKCISCNVCTSVCHQGIDVMAFASRGLAMQDPQCVRCSACVQQCPTGVLSFGRLEAGKKIVLDKLPAKSA
jgi:ferredoxin